MGNRHVWNVRLGPCFCGVRPGADGSFDLHRWQISHITDGSLDVDVLVATTEIPSHVAPEIERRVTPDWLVVSHRVCPYARRAGAVVPGVPLASVTRVDHDLDVCLSDRPDQLIVAMLARPAQARTPEQHYLAGV